MADKTKLVANEVPPGYTPVAAQQSVVVNPYGQPAFHQQQQLAMPYGPQPPQGVQNNVIIQQPQNQPMVVVQAPPPDPPNYMWLSCVVFWVCCNPLAGGIAFILSLMSAGAASDNNRDSAKQLGKASMITSLVGLFLSVLGWIFVIIWWMKWRVEEQKIINGLNDYNNY